METGPAPLPDYTEYDTRLAAYAVVRDGDRVLLALWNEAARPLWTMPGGGVELDETPEDGVVREVREETGYDVEVTGLLGIDTHVVPPSRRLVPAPTARPMKAVRVYYAARVVGGSLRAEVGGTTDEARWFERADVAALDRTSSVDVALGLADG